MSGPHLARYYWGDGRWCVAKRLSNGEERIIARSMSETTARRVARLLNADLAQRPLTVSTIHDITTKGPQAP